MAKINKASVVMELLNKGYSPKEITERMAVSTSYIHALKKQMAHKAEEAKVKAEADARAIEVD